LVEALVSHRGGADPAPSDRRRGNRPVSLPSLHGISVANRNAQRPEISRELVFRAEVLTWRI